MKYNIRNPFSPMNSMLTLCFFLTALCTHAVQYRVLFLGNSYTQVNDLPSIISSLATSSGDQLVVQSNTPGGYTFQQHSEDPASVALIAAGNWDYVVLQEQSQKPSFPDQQVAHEVYPYARKLDSLIKVYNPCAKTLFYMTWGRKNGDAGNCVVFPPVCSYQGMDSLLQLRYTIMAETNHAALSPVARIWRTLRNTQPAIELYNADESHPSYAGSYAAACSFYSMIFRKDPALCTFTGPLQANTASLIRNTAKAIVYDSLNYWYRFNTMPVADFSYSHSGQTVTFTGSTPGATAYSWNFGDGSSPSALENPVHTYNTSGVYIVAMAATFCGRTDTVRKTITLGATAIQAPVAGTTISIFPNPAGDVLHLISPVKVSQIAVYDISGGCMIRANTLPDNGILDIHTLLPGLYQLVVQAGHETSSCRFEKR